MCEATATKQAIEFGECSLRGLESIERGTVGTSRPEDGSGITLLFDTLVLNLQGAATPQSGVIGAVIQVPVSVRKEKSFRGFRVDVRGTASLSPGGGATLLVHVGGISKRVDFAPGQDWNQSFGATFFAAHNMLPGEEDPEVREIEPLMLTLVLSGQRSMLTDYIDVQVATVDIVGVWAW